MVFPQCESFGEPSSASSWCIPWCNLGRCSDVFFSWFAVAADGGENTDLGND